MRPLFTQAHALVPIGLQNGALTAATYVRNLRYFTSYFHETLGRWEERVDEPVDAQRERQWDLLGQLVERAREHVPYYRFLPPVVDTGEAASSIEKTLANIPPLEKAVYRARSRDFVSRDVPARKLLQSSTSGTTGTALPVWHTSDRIAEGHAARWRSLSNAARSNATRVATSDDCSRR